jgi:transcriptional/translational regulatory protein YebC/TACO1
VQNRKAIQDAGIDYEQAEVGFVPNVSIEADADQAKKVLALIDALEDSDDVQNVFTNMDLSAEVIAELAAEDG